MVDWTKSMIQTFEYYIVDPNTWGDSKRLDNVISSSISRDSEAETLGSATIDVSESIGESYVRIYLITIQNNIKERHPLGTFLVQTPSYSFDGKIKNISMDAYTPLIELKDGKPPIGYHIPVKSVVMDEVYRLTRDHIRAPVYRTSMSDILQRDFIASTDNTWLEFIKDLMANVKYEFGLDEMGRILFSPIQDIASLQPVWTYNDDNSSLLYPDITMSHDLYGVPNVVEVVYSVGKASLYSRVVNNDENSPTSVYSRGREIVHRVINPDFAGIANQSIVNEYAKELLRNLSSIEYTISYSHGYCPVRIGDCVRLNYKRAGLNDIKAKVVSQTIDCQPGCKVTEKAVFTVKLWR